MSKIYLYDEEGYFVNSQESVVNEKGIEILEPNSTFLKPLPPKEGYEVKFIETEWVYIELPKPEPKPTPTVEEQNEEIRQKREQAYQETSDHLKQDYDEALARGEADADAKRVAWLASKDKVREENPYVTETVDKTAK